MKKFRCTVCGQVFYGEFPPVPCPVCGAGADAFVEIPTEEASVFRRDTSEKFLIVGGGAAGLEAAKAIRLRNAQCMITMLCGENIIPYNRPAVSDVLGDGYSFEAVALEPYDYYAKNGIGISCGVKVTAVDPAKKTVSLSDGSTRDYDRLLLATGANPFNPIKAPEGAIPCRTLRTFEDALAMRQDYANKRAIVVGGGILGLEAALALRELNTSVTVVELGDRILPIQADADVAAKLQKALESAAGIRFITGRTVASLGGNGATLTDGTRVDADCLLASIGVRSETTLAKQLGLTVNRGIVVDAGMRTSAPDIYAAGDCAEYNGRVAGLWAAAVDQGRVAGACMAGDEAEYHPIVPATAFEGADVKLFSAGMVGGDRMEVCTADYPVANTFRRLYLREGKLVGAIFYGDVSRSGEAISMIDAGAGRKEALRLL